MPDRLTIVVFVLWAVTVAALLAYTLAATL